MAEERAGIVKREVSAKQRACYEMRRSGSTWEEIGQAMSMAANTVRAHVVRAQRNGMPVLPTERYARRVDVSDPEAVKRAILKHPVFAPGAEGSGEAKFNLQAFVEMAQAAGVPPRMAGAIGRRLELNFGPVREELKRLTLNERVAKTFEKADMVLGFIDEASIPGMNAKDLATAYGILVDKALVMGGRPNVIVDFNSRKQLETLMPQFIAEAKRRGLTIDGTATVVQEKVIVEGEDVGSKTD